jgi:hypothetical protein
MSNACSAINCFSLQFCFKWRSRCASLTSAHCTRLPTLELLLTDAVLTAQLRGRQTRL